MALPGKIAISYVVGETAQPQPAGVDISICEVHKLRSNGVLGVSFRELPETEPIEPQNGWWYLGQGVYKVRYCEIVEIPLDVVALCFPRSSLLRMGVDLRCTVWDPGYKGRGEGLLIVHNPYGVRLEVKARVAQLVFIKLVERPERGYTGVYYGEGL